MRKPGLALLFILACGCSSIFTLPAYADDSPLHRQIDQLVAKQFGTHQPAPLSEDAEFFRRVWLDLAGTVPSADETRQFLADKSPAKRQQAVDQLLASAEYVLHMQEAFHGLLMERRGDHKQWQEFLRLSFAENRPWDEMVRAMLQPEPAAEADQGAAFFLSKRLENYGQNPIDHPGLTRDIGRLFLGIDLQCAQCHNHLFVDEYKQVDFQGLLAVTQTLKPGKDAAVVSVEEKPLAKKLEFISVFDPTEQATGPRVPFGKEFEIPAELPKDQSYSPLTLLSAELPRAENPQFARNIANRLWHLMLGRGLVEPLDTHHADNPPSHPEVLDLLTRELIAHKFDLKWLLRELALSETYQRSSVLQDPTLDLPLELYLVALPKRLSAEQTLHSLVRATGTMAGEEQTATVAKLMPRFLAAMANPAREHEDHRHPSVQSALFLSNDNEVLGVIARRPGNLVDRLLAMNDDAALADELYLSTVARPPMADEQTELQAFLAEDKDQREARLTHWIWALVASTEFGVNH